MDSFVTLCLLIMPGYLARLIFSHLNNSKNNNDKFDIIMESLLFDIIIIPITYLLVYVFNPEIAYSDLSTFFLYANNIIPYGISALITSIVITLLWYKYAEKYTYVINRIRGEEKNTIAIGKMLSDLTFNDGTSHLVEIYKDNKLICSGKISGMYFSNGEIIVNDDNDDTIGQIKTWGDLKYKHTYINFNNGFIIKEIDIDNSFSFLTENEDTQK